MSRLETAPEATRSRLLTFASMAKVISPPFFGQVNCCAAAWPAPSASAPTEAKSNAMRVMIDLLGRVPLLVGNFFRFRQRYRRPEEDTRRTHRPGVPAVPEAAAQEPGRVPS